MQEQTVIRYEADTAGSHWASATKASANVVPVVPTKNGKGEKRGKGVCRIYGTGSELLLINTVTVEVCKRLNAKKLDESVFKGQKSYPAKKLADELGVVVMPNYTNKL
ncbi:MAG: hypothetical protein WCW84_06790 [Sulfurimonas sp.]|jgi:hypothetical protein